MTKAIVENIANLKKAYVTLKAKRQEHKEMTKRLERVIKRLAYLSTLEKELRVLAKHAKDHGKGRKEVGRKALENISKKFKAGLKVVNHLMDHNFERVGKK